MSIKGLRSSTQVNSSVKCGSKYALAGFMASKLTEDRNKLMQLIRCILN